jgi:eukaryotic-like serine/threonine-protein kinase
VRKAEVPAPSDFNRRVTPELDAIVLKALSRDVADRYQTAAQFAAALDALISGYRFDPKELRQFMRQLFRKEYAKEVEDAQVSLDPPPPGPAVAMARPAPASAPPPVGPPPQPAMLNGEPPPPAAPEPPGDKPRGFWGNWGNLFRKRK